ncbi:MAG: hypothetical protein U0894_08600 [Pirellulales bacterium]
MPERAPGIIDSILLNVPGFDIHTGRKFQPPQPGRKIPPQVSPAAYLHFALFLIPLLIVTCVIALFTGFGLPVPLPKIRKKRRVLKAEGGSWQKAHELADMLSSSSIANTTNS